MGRTLRRCAKPVAIANRSSTISQAAIDNTTERPLVDELAYRLTLDETTAAINTLSSGKAAGPDAIAAEMYKYGGINLTKSLVKLLNNIWDSRAVPQEFKDATMVHIYKSKGDKSICDDHRGISLRSIAGKILTRILLNRLSVHLADVLPECALLAHSVDDIQAVTNAFARSARHFGLTIGLKKTEAIYQPKPGADYTAPTITFDNNPLKVTDKFTYLGSTISQNALSDDEISPRIGKASGSFGILTKRLWSERGVQLATKINVYCAVVLPTLLYRCEAWIPHRRHLRRLDQFHVRCLRRIANIKWQDMMSNTEVLQRCVLRRTGRRSSNTGRTTKAVQGRYKGNVEVMWHSPQHMGGHRERPCPLA